MLKKIYYSFYVWIEAFFGKSDLNTPQTKDTSESNHKQTTSSIDTSDKKKPVDSFSVKILNWDQDTVKTEWLINKDNEQYQVRYFPIEIFENKEHLLEHGRFLKAFLYVSSGQMTIEFVDGSNLVSKSDFPDDYMLKKEDFSLFKFK